MRKTSLFQFILLVLNYLYPNKALSVLVTHNVIDFCVLREEVVEKADEQFLNPQLFLQFSDFCLQSV